MSVGGSICCSYRVLIANDDGVVISFEGEKTAISPIPLGKPTRIT